MSDATDRLAAALARSASGGAANPDTGRDRPAEDVALLKGQITDVGSGGLCTVTTDGVNDRVDVPSLYVPTLGDVVWVLDRPPMLLVLGPSATW